MKKLCYPKQRKELMPCPTWKADDPIFSCPPVVHDNSRALRHCASPHLATGYAAAGGVGSIADTNPLAELGDLSAIGDEIEGFPIRREIPEVVEEIADASDVVGIEPSALEFLVRVVIWADQRVRGA
jgi:hypothetical protein